MARASLTKFGRAAVCERMKSRTSMPANRQSAAKRQVKSRMFVLRERAAGTTQSASILLQHAWRFSTENNEVNYFSTVLVIEKSRYTPRVESLICRLIAKTEAFAYPGSQTTSFA
jgi:hypothetical protein